MPKLNKKMAKTVEDAEEQEGFGLLPEGWYVGSLREVTTGEGDKGPFWTWIFEIPEEFEHSGHRIWHVTSLSEKALGMPTGLKATFAAFGEPADTDTDELCGKWVTLQIEHRTIQKGKRKGEMGTSVAKILPYEEGAELGGGDDEEEPF